MPADIMSMYSSATYMINSSPTNFGCCKARWRSSIRICTTLHPLEYFLVNLCGFMCHSRDRARCESNACDGDVRTATNVQPGPLRDVYLAPPLISPLCWRMRFFGATV